MNNARLIAELQALTLGIHLVGLARLPEVMSAGRVSPDGYEPKANEPKDQPPAHGREE